ncbi:MAG: trans-aconitate methyltransferase [Candidatus Aeolococcus gillhamiae]|uniref:Trans-aconitate methyltransferase n=1 Tax=Candidatus Aeolococcus gillhamiae TaxID=3127015 RepID=A0A2W5Z0Z7_9BACT|nr:MAG: trans-aconitate methyltransferase [Candidatus Dormibacter sp. RRmetagenome_bin12]
MPFDDLLAMVAPVPGGKVLDLGCGTGSLTAELHRHCGAAETLGVDSSEAMLGQAAAHTGEGLHFERADIAEIDRRDIDVVFANASLQWVPDHPALLGRLRTMLATRGQLAFQVPANADHPSHRLAAVVAAEEPFATALGGRGRDEHLRAVLAPDAYAEALDRLGAREQHVRLQVYGHHLPGTAAVVEWVRGTMLTPYRAALEPELYEAFVSRYSEALEAELGSQRPYFYAFKRILAWARFA